jgi:propionyl-CoA synthetase
VLADHGAKALFTAPTALRAIKKVDPDAGEIGKYDLSAFQTLFMAGERLDPETYHWAHDSLGVPVVDHWWQTETGWPIAANPRGLEPLPVKPGSATKPMPGWDVQILDSDGSRLPPGAEGAIAIGLPLPPGALPTLWGDDERYIESYLTRYDGFYLTGDSGFVDQDGYLFVMGRTDDVINVAGHRLSTGAMEAVLAEHPAVAECAVIGIQDPLKGQLPTGFVVLKAGAEIGEEKLGEELVEAVRRAIGPVAAFRDVYVVEALPKTRSGKILRKTMRAIADGRDEPVPSTIEDPSVLDGLRDRLTGR